MFTLRKTLKPSSLITTIHRSITSATRPEPSTTAEYDDLITTAGKNKDFTTISSLLTQRYNKGIFTTNNTFKFISKDLTAINDLQKTISDLNGNTRKKAFESLVACLCKFNFVDQALTTAELAADESAADVTTFHPILSVLTRRKDFERAWRVVDVIKAKKIPRDVMCYNFFLTAYAFTGNLRPCVDVLRKMAEEGLKADARTYDALVLGACKQGKMGGAIVIMRKMVESGVEPIYATYAHVIGGMVKLGLYTQAVKFVMSFAGKDKKLDSHNFGLLAVRLMAKKQTDEAESVMEEMAKRGLVMARP
ncbi:tetratricopeptide repeat (TPR)-like superfamily protein [Artemisia annua]|uniref:Tetratricopeptide repeat (TPR)-like superfamily protein n=1 Tax=Artemisia annua TaxID=35608 RepID=A0A2U1MKK6_ARTAN|nr:tetratricopeptide repeat (TPR)-like superfamily protein [Artemisia annua]